MQTAFHVGPDWLADTPQKEHIMKKLLGTTLLATLIGLTCAAAQAEYVGPNGAPSSIKQLQEATWDHQFVTLKGHITRRVAEDLYEFADGSGTILLDIDKKNWLWPADAKIDDKTTVEVYGKYVRKMIGYTKIDVVNLRVVK